LVAAFGLALLATLGFALRLALMLWLWDGPAHAVHPVEDWMTPRYLVRVYGLDPAGLAAALQVAPGLAPRQTLSQIAAARGVPVADLIAAVEALRPPPAGPD
jgi:hypothetical protein